MPSRTTDSTPSRSTTSARRSTAELEAFDASFSARTSAGDPIILALQGDTVALVRAVSSDENGPYNRIRTKWLGHLDGATLVREMKPETARELGGVTAISLEHERIGGQLKIDLPHQPQELEELFAALRQIVGLAGDGSPAEPMVAFT
jgi:hypothetical protein